MTGGGFFRDGRQPDAYLVKLLPAPKKRFGQGPFVCLFVG